MTVSNYKIFNYWTCTGYVYLWRSSLSTKGASAGTFQVVYWSHKCRLITTPWLLFAALLNVSFGDIINYFKFPDFKKNFKVGLSQVGKMHLVCSIPHNALTCLYENITSVLWSRSFLTGGLFCLLDCKHKTICLTSQCKISYI